MLPSAGEKSSSIFGDSLANERRTDLNQTLNAFLQESGLPADAGNVTSKDDNITIEKVLEEKQAFDLSLNFEKLGLAVDRKVWSVNAPSSPSIVDTLPSSSNLLNVSVEPIATSGSSVPYIICSSADRLVSSIATEANRFTFHKSYPQLQDSPVLTWAFIDERYMLCGSMSGKLTLFDIHNEIIIEQRQDHTKYIVKVATWKDGKNYHVVTAGWDGRLILYHLTVEGASGLGVPKATLTVPTNPETILFIPHPDDAQPVLLLRRRDSTHMFYYTIPQQTQNLTPLKQTFELLGKQSLAPHSNAWVAFTPSCVVISPQDPYMVAVATYQQPHMKMMLVRLLIPPIGAQAAEAVQELTQASQTRTELALKDREETAIIISCNTMASQTSYSTPLLVWRPDGSGMWVNSDDGAIRGIDVSTGKVTATLQGHMPGSRIRCLWAGYSEASDVKGEQTEWLVSGGFDQKLIVWLSLKETSD